MKDKKKVMVLGLLVVAMLAIGAFQFIGPSSSSAPIAETDEATEVTDPETTTVADGEGVEGEEGAEVEEEGDAKKLNIEGFVAESFDVRDPFDVPSGVEPEKAKAPEPEKPVEPRVKPQQKPRSLPGEQPVNPRIFGDLPPLGGGGAPVDNSPQYRVKGVLVGQRSVAVVEDEEGNQKLVPVGGSIDGDTKVVKIEQGKVTVERNGKKKVLSIQEKARND